MMLIKMTTSIAGVDFSAAPGQEIEMPEAEALRLIDAGFATAVKANKVETAAKRTSTPRKKSSE